MKRFIISEDEKNRILGMHQDATKKHYLGEQQATAGDIGVAAKPTYENNGAKYYVPNLDSDSYTKFTTFNQFDNLPAKLANLKKLNVQANLGAYNPLAVPQETFDKQLQTYTDRIMKGQGTESAIEGLGLLTNLEFLEKSLSNALNAYLISWRPNSKGMDILNSTSFTQKPVVVNAKKYISNFDEVFPKVLQAQSAISGLSIV